MGYPPAVRRRVVTDLEAVQAVRGTVPRALVLECASDIGCSPSTVWSWWRQHRDGNGIPAPAPRSSELPDDVMEVLFASAGNVSRAHRQLLANPDTAAITPPRRTLAHQWNKVDAAVRAYADDGAEGLLANQMRVRRIVEDRNQLWRMDHQEFPVWVLPAGRSSKPLKPWVTTIIDDATRMIMSVLVTVERPDSTSVAVALADAIRLKPTTTPDVEVGGVPLAVATDNGGEFRSKQVTGMLRRLGVASKRTYPYMKHLNGKAERVQQTMQHELGHRLPGWADGAKTLRLKDLYGLDGELLTEELLTELILDWVHTYNTERPHSQLDGNTPLQAWAAQQTPLRTPDMDAVRLAMMPTAKPRKVTPDGISVRGQLYTSGELAQLKIVGHDVDVRYLPHDDSFIEVFDGDRWLCTCVPAHKLDEEGLDLMAAVRKEQYVTARAYQDAARERRQFAAATATPDKPTLLPLSTPRPGSLYDGDDDLLALSEMDDQPPRATAEDIVVPVGDDDADPWDVEPDTAPTPTGEAGPSPDELDPSIPHPTDPFMFGDPA